ncbi:hypothetical protein I4U23_030782 [Adineta vaga]|nr:hypothetical protein I4U23_030782 [Adineta vaga]
MRDFNFDYDDMLSGIEETERHIRGFGCYGPNNRNEYRCRYHCRNLKFKSGFCSRVSDYKECACTQSPTQKSKFRQIFPPTSTVTKKA